MFSTSPHRFDRRLARMNKHRLILSTLFVSFGIIKVCNAAFQIPLGYAFISLGPLIAKFAYDKSYCKFAECCHEKSDPHNYIKFDNVQSRLTELLDEKLFGQHLVNQMLPNIIKRHLNNENPEKPMVISLHGWTGSGKTHTSKLVAEGMFEKGINSRFVIFLNPGKFFASIEVDEKDMLEQKKILYEKIAQQASICPHSLVVIEEVDKMQPELVQVLGLFFDHHLQDRQFNHLTFVMLSNAGGSKISNYARQQFELGYERESIKLSDVERILNEGAFYEDGGLYQSDLISRYKIDHFIPILPLERRHVRQCIRKYLSERYHLEKSEQETVNSVMAYIDFWPNDIRLFSLSGCKSVNAKVDAVLKN